MVDILDMPHCRPMGGLSPPTTMRSYAAVCGGSPSTHGAVQHSPIGVLSDSHSSDQPSHWPNISVKQEEQSASVSNLTSIIYADHQSSPSSPGKRYLRRAKRWAAIRGGGSGVSLGQPLETTDLTEEPEDDPRDLKEGRGDPAKERHHHKQQSAAAILLTAYDDDRHRFRRLADLTGRPLINWVDSYPSVGSQLPGCTFGAPPLSLYPSSPHFTSARRCPQQTPADLAAMGVGVIRRGRPPPRLALIDAANELGAKTGPPVMCMRPQRSFGHDTAAGAIPYQPLPFPLVGRDLPALSASWQKWSEGGDLAIGEHYERDEDVDESESHHQHHLKEQSFSAADAIASGRLSESPSSSAESSSLGSGGGDLSPVSQSPTLRTAATGVEEVCWTAVEEGCRASTPPPPERPWIKVQAMDREKSTAHFTVLCYNVLCDKSATAGHYSHCPSWALKWHYRRTRILHQISAYNADIVTLQEVETEQYHIVLLPEMVALGYAGIFSPKSRAKTMNDDERKYVDGCAIFWKTHKFEQVSEHLVEFTRLAMARADCSEMMLNRVMPRDNIALVAVLSVKQAVGDLDDADPSSHTPSTERVEGSPLVVCTAHIHWDPALCDVKLVQTMMLAQELWRILDTHVCRRPRWRHLSAAHVPTLVCADLNSLPDSGVFEFLTRASISRRHADFKAFRGESCLSQLSSCGDVSTFLAAAAADTDVCHADVRDNDVISKWTAPAARDDGVTCDDVITGGDVSTSTAVEDVLCSALSSDVDAGGDVLEHSLRLESAYNATPIPFTNYTTDFAGVIDYILATPRSLTRLGVLGPLDADWLQDNYVGGLPHPHVPSDHVPIMAHYQILPPDC